MALHGGLQVGAGLVKGLSGGNNVKHKNTSIHKKGTLETSSTSAVRVLLPGSVITPNGLNQRRDT